MLQAPVLPSWNDGAARSALLRLVAAVCDEHGPYYVPPHERVAVFAHDGTLCCEFPLPVHALFIGTRLEQLAARRPTLRDLHPFSAFLREDLPRVHGLGWRGIVQLGLVVHAGLPLDDFAERCAAWLAAAAHPWLGRPLASCCYLPQLELLAFLRAHGFTPFIVTAGDSGVVRAIAHRVYGIPPHQVIGTCARTRIEDVDGVAQLVKLAQEERHVEGEEKVRSIARHIGVRPLLAFGNADRDLAMLRYVAAGAGPRLALLLHHDDAQREFAYDSGFALNPLDEALERAASLGLQVVSMRRDWRTVFGPA
ncbi:haloacid dehalogenase-like hydrolase [Ramlibacter sp. USB13]|uniref:Haloacid dehalogenase-like hydrolase n=1 Tax=Ramlibacter cellulosilyticus TaxID=2764187 RepID=A0A923MTE3_9BURK|nr:HAD family hydrolase [Ramlibacter cellulosilyticus]MBC5783829.1 haloacid dehalogenase-like hydrolase [Ramlibacter cellulosilyticus]